MKMWAVIMPPCPWVIGAKETLLTRTIKKTRRESIAACTPPVNWKQNYRLGFRCKRITVTVEGES